MSFRIRPLPAAPFRALFDLDDDALTANGARRMVADAPHSAPCRVSLADAEPGERLLLVSHRHLDAPASPYRGEGPSSSARRPWKPRPQRARSPTCWVAACCPPGSMTPTG